jgi:hypothetical protein
MKKKAGILLKIFIGLVVLLLLLLVAVPILFKDRIKTTVEQTINESVNAKVSFSDYKLGFFRNFPNLTFSLNDVSVTGVGKFENDTLTSFKSLNLVFSLPSLLKKSGYEIRSVKIDEAAINALVLKDGSENWDILKDSEDTDTEEESSSPMKILLRKVDVLDSRISYIDQSSDIQTFLDDVNFNLTGDMTLSETNLLMLINAGELTYIMEGTKYLNKVTARADINLFANLDSMKFYLKENYLLLNDLKLNFAGVVIMPFDDIETNLTFSTEKASLKALMSLIPAVYMKDYNDLQTSGDISLSGSAKGVYSDADSTMPDISLDVKISNGLINYPSLPEKIKNINLSSGIYVDGRDMDKTTVDVNNFHMELAGNPFDIKFSLKTPMSDPDFIGSMVGKLDLTALTRAVPLDSIDLSGLIDMSVSMAGRMSMIEKEQYDKFRASGNMSISNMSVAMTGYPEVKINGARFEFSPAFASLEKADLNVGTKSDFSITGKLENYLPYLFRNDIIKGNLSLHSNLTDLSEIMSAMAEDTEEVDDTTGLAVIKIPENIDFDFNALIDKFLYNKIKANNLRGHIVVRNGVLSIKETGMQLLGGTVVMNADYDTRDSLKPSVKADLVMESLGIRDAFNTFNSVQKLAPTSNGINGNAGIKLSYSSLLGKDFMPVIQSMNGGGKLQSDEVTLVESAVYRKIKEVLKLSDNYSNTFKDINISFKINDGRIYVSPFNTKAGNLKLNISGDQGLDQTLNYIVRAELPRSDLGNQVNSLIDNLSAQAAAFGFAFKPADLIKVNVRISGTFLKPVISPFFGKTPPDSSGGLKENAKEAVKQIVESKADEVKQDIKNEAQIQADKLVLEAEEKGRLLRDEAAQTAEKIRKEADIQAQKLIKEAEPKGAVAKLAAQKGAESIKKEADKRADQLVKEADAKAIKLVEEAKARRDEFLK